MLVIGIGHPDRSDDGIGQWVANTLKERRPGIRVVTGTGETADLLDWWADEEEAWVVDAIASRRPPGTVVRIDAHRDELPSERSRASSHAFGLAEAIELGRAMNNLPQRLIVFGIEGQDFSPGRQVSPAVRQAAEDLVDTLIEELENRDA